MRINFFEEYPTEENMSKLDYISWPSTLLIATSSLEEFEDIQTKYSDIYPHITFGWWPTIPESYWVSGFSNPSDLHNLFKELTSKTHKKELPVLIDFELPFRKHLIIKNAFHICANKRKISKFITDAHKYNLKVYTAEYPAISKTMRLFWQVLGISPSLSSKHIKIPMCYSSMKNWWLGDISWTKVKKFETKYSHNNPSFISFGLGVISNGVFGDEPILSPEKLKIDIEWARKCNISEVFVFRLGGIDKSYLKILE